MNNFYVVKYGCTFLKNFEEFSTHWVTNPEDARRYSKAEAQVVAYAVEGEVIELGSLGQ